MTQDPPMCGFKRGMGGQIRPIMLASWGLEPQQNAQPVCEHARCRQCLGLYIPARNTKDLLLTASAGHDEPASESAPRPNPVNCAVCMDFNSSVHTCPALWRVLC